ncbi:MAG: gliding motility-associated C-terminal domain-containing protein [Bacteroidota bacterium]
MFPVTHIQHLRALRRAVFSFSAFIVFCSLTSNTAFAQNYVFAKLAGSPMDVTGWNLDGEARIGDTFGDNQAGAQNELILCTPNDYTSGSAFYTKPVNISRCQKWVATFDFRMGDGSNQGADGIAFCFLANPPTGFQNGGRMGTPTKPRGLIVAMDQFKNGNCSGEVPKIELVYCYGQADYQECPNAGGNTVLTYNIPPASFSRQNYHQMTITYDNGNITIFLTMAGEASRQVLTGFYNIDFAGYFGFTAGTGSNYDTHSIRNFSLFTYKPILSAPDAGPDRVICSNNPTEIGVRPGDLDPYTYYWTPDSGLSNRNISNPTLTVTNNTGNNQILTYYLTKDSLVPGAGSLCAYADAVTFTVRPNGANAPREFKVCGGQLSQPLVMQDRGGYANNNTTWEAIDSIEPSGLVPPNGVGRTMRFDIPIPPGLLTPILRTYRVTAVSNNCIDTQTVRVTVYPPLYGMAGKDTVLCGGGALRIGKPPVAGGGYTYQWVGPGISDTRQANPTFTAPANNTDSTITYFLFLNITSPVSGNLVCESKDTIKVAVPPKPKAYATQNASICAGGSLQLGGRAIPRFKYKWLPANLAVYLNNDTLADPVFIYTGTVPGAPLIMTLQTTYIVGNTICRNSSQVFITITPGPVLKPAFAVKACPLVNATLRLDPLAGQITTWDTSSFLTPDPANQHQATARADNNTADTIIVNFGYSARVGNCVVHGLAPLKVAPGPLSELPAAISKCSGSTFTMPQAPRSNYSYRWLTTDNLSDPNIANPQLNLNAANDQPTLFSFEVQITDNTPGSSHCVKTYRTVVTVNPLPFAKLPADTILCQSTPAQIGFTPRPNCIYQWSSRKGLSDSTLANPLFNFSNPGGASATLPYTLTVTDTVTHCTKSASVNIRLKQALTVDAGNARTICQDIITRLGSTPIAGYTYTWLNAGPAFDNAAVSNPNLNTHSLSPGPHTFIVRAGNDTCSATDTVIVTLLPRPESNLQRTITTCSGRPVTMVNPPVARYNYQWINNLQGLTGVTNAEATITRYNTGTSDLIIPYYLRTEAENGCLRTDTVMLTVQPNPVPDLGSVVKFCANIPTRIGPNPLSGYTYSWSPNRLFNNPASAQPEITVLSSDTNESVVSVTLVTTNAKGCDTTATLNLTMKPLPVLDLPDSLEVCSGETLVIGPPHHSVPAGQDPYTYQWNTAANLNSSTRSDASFSMQSIVKQTLTYTLTAMRGGCPKTDSVRVIVHPLPATPVIVGRHSMCPGVQGAVYRVQNRLPGIVYNWVLSPGASIVSGQLTDSLVVNFSGTQPTINFKVTAVNLKGCTSDTGRFTLNFEQGVIPETPLSPYSRDTLCRSNAQFVTYTTVQTPFSSWKWHINPEAGTILSVDTTWFVNVRWNGDANGKVWVDEVSRTPTNTCSGQSDTLRVSILPSPMLKNSISGDYRACQGKTSVYTARRTAPESIFTWEITGGTGQSSTEAIQVTWSTLGPVHLRVTESIGECYVTTDTTFSTFPVPNPLVTLRDSVICPDDISRPYNYRVSGLPGSHYVWTITGGTFTTSGGSDSLVRVTWDTVSFPKTVSVIEEPLGNCNSSSLNFNVYFERPRVNFISVTRKPASPDVMLVHYKITSATTVTPEPFVNRRTLFPTQGPWENLGSARLGDSLFIDNNAPATKQFEYNIAIKDGCDFTTTSDSRSNVVLSADAKADSNSSSLSWTPYSGWPNGLNKYEIYRWLDGATDSVLVGTVPAGQTTWIQANAGDGFVQCYLIRAIQNGDNPPVSYSNKVCITFENPVKAYNVISPNGDGHNDEWKVGNLHLYPENEVSIFNRWGKEMMHQTAYKQDWGGDDLPAGVYYYIIKVKGAVASKGWLSINR